MDIHEYLKGHTFNPEGKCKTHFEVSRPCPVGIYGISDHYVILDSFEKTELSQPARGTYIFNFMIQGVTGNQVIGVKDKIETVIEMQIYPFSIPLLQDVPYVTNSPPINLSLPELIPNPAPPLTAPLDSPLNQLYANNMVTLEFKELSYQSVSTLRGTRYHFQFNATLPALQDKLQLVPSRDIYVFTDPIQAIHGLTAIFRGPDIFLNMPEDCLYGVQAIVAPGQLLQFNYTSHGLNINDRIFISGFNSTSAIINKYVNRNEGHIVGLGGFTADTFRLNPDVGTTSLGLAVGDRISAASRIKICIAKNRIRIPLRIRGVIQRLTNYIAP